MKRMVMDGNSIMNRAFYGIRLLSTKDSHFTNAPWAFSTFFVSILCKLRRQVEPDGIVAAFDLHALTFRYRLYDGYKAGRHTVRSSGFCICSASVSPDKRNTYGATKNTRSRPNRSAAGEKDVAKLKPLCGN